MTKRQLDRREFIGGSAAAVAACTCSLAGVAGCYVENTAAKPVTAKAGQAGRIALGPASGLGLGQQIKVTAPELDDTVLVARISETEVKAVSIFCTHFGSEVVLDLEKQLFHCPNHDSTFGYDGQVIEGPASDPLPTYEVVEEGRELFLLLPRAKS